MLLDVEVSVRIPGLDAVNKDVIIFIFYKKHPHLNSLFPSFLFYLVHFLFCLCSLSESLIFHSIFPFTFCWFFCVLVLFLLLAFITLPVTICFCHHYIPGHSNPCLLHFSNQCINHTLGRAPGSILSMNTYSYKRQKNLEKDVFPKDLLQVFQCKSWKFQDTRKNTPMKYFLF